MLQKTRGIVLSTTKYRETSLVVRAYTEAFGMRSYLVNNVRSSRSKGGMAALYQPLTQLDMVVYEKQNANLQRISQARLGRAYKSLPFEPRKAAIALFLAEVTGKALRQEDANPPLYAFIGEGLLVLDGLERFANFHLQFLLRMPHFLGFGVQKGSDVFAHMERQPEPLAADLLDRLLEASYTEPVPLNGQTRSYLLGCLLDFYAYCIDGFGEVKSLAVLRATLSD